MKYSHYKLSSQIKVKGKNKSNIIDYIDSIQKIIKRKKLQPGTFPEGLHKRWMIIDELKEPNNDGEYIDVGMQFDLYYVTEPSPSRKYLTVKAIGGGASAGELKHNKSSHRGYYQREVTIQLSHSGVPLVLEALAPQTDNDTNLVGTSTGVTFILGQIVGPPPTRGLKIVLYGKSNATLMRAFSVSVDPNPRKLKVAYWLVVQGIAIQLIEIKPKKI